jgi:hypothetical protein
MYMAEQLVAHRRRSGTGGSGVYRISLHGHGLVGATGTAGGAAVVGATNGVAGAWEWPFAQASATDQLPSYY